jgi:hypothetical protein
MLNANNSLTQIGYSLRATTENTQNIIAISSLIYRPVRIKEASLPSWEGPFKLESSINIRGRIVSSPEVVPTIRDSGYREIPNDPALSITQTDFSGIDLQERPLQLANIPMLELLFSKNERNVLSYFYSLDIGISRIFFAFVSVYDSTTALISPENGLSLRSPFNLRSVMVDFAHLDKDADICMGNIINNIREYLDSR